MRLHAAAIPCIASLVLLFPHCGARESPDNAEALEQLPPPDRSPREGSIGMRHRPSRAELERDTRDARAE